MSHSAIEEGDKVSEARGERSRRKACRGVSRCDGIS